MFRVQASGVLGVRFRVCVITMRMLIYEIAKIQRGGHILSRVGALGLFSTNCLIDAWP